MEANPYVMEVSFRATLRNVASLLWSRRNEPRYGVRFNQFSQSMERLDGTPIQVHHYIELAISLEADHEWDGRPPSVELVRQAATHVSRQQGQTYHPVREYLLEQHALLEADLDLKRVALDMLDRWLTDYCKVKKSEAPNLRARQSRCLLIGAVARIMQPGCQHDLLPIFASPQGWRKSTMIREMVPRDEWRSSTAPDLRSKDAYQSCENTWIGEIPELKSILSTSPEVTKAWITSRTDKYRKPYARHFTHSPRQCVWWGSCNPPFVLPDKTGNRRYWVLEMREPADIQAIIQNRHLLWGAAMIRYLAGEPWHLTDGAELAQVEAEREPYECDVDSWHHRAVLYRDEVRQKEEVNREPYLFRSADFLAYPLGIPLKDQTRSHVARASTALKRAGFFSYRTMHEVGGIRKQARVWRLDRVND